MHFGIADTFTSSLAKLAGDEQKQAKTAAFDLQLNPAHPSLSLHKLDRAKDKNFWSVRVSRDLRIIVHKTDASLLLCYVDHHDQAYRWAERRKLETHPTTGAAQLVEIRQTVQDIIVPNYVQKETVSPAKPAFFDGVSDEALLGYGVPLEWLDDVRGADEDGLLQLTDHLPSEAGEALLELATGGTPQVAPVFPAGSDPLLHPDAQRRFRMMTGVEELARALDYPWDRWAVFLHPAQQEIVQKECSGPARVAGSAGTGKTIVALHRAVHLARGNPESRVLLTTFSAPLANALKSKLFVLVRSEPTLAERIEVHAIDDIGAKLYRGNIGPLTIADPVAIEQMVRNALDGSEDVKFSERFVLGEWKDVVDAWQLDSWETYRDVKRLGRKTRISEQQRKSLWGIFERVRVALTESGKQTTASMFSAVSTHLKGRKHSPFDFAVVDEAQDVNVSQLRFLAALAGAVPNGLFFAGDLGQRIFQTPFSWKSLGVDVRGRSQTLRINYRTSHQIRRQADHLLAPEIADVDGNVDDRRGTVSVFNGPEPSFRVLATPESEADAVAAWLQDRIKEAVAPQEIGLFVRSGNEFPRALDAVSKTGIEVKILNENLELPKAEISICTMHLAKGLEFKAVVVMACDDEVIPSQARMEQVADEADLEEVYDTERQLLYVACTRARDFLLVTAVHPESEFLDDLRG